MKKSIFGLFFGLLFLFVSSISTANAATEITVYSYERETPYYWGGYSSFNYDQGLAMIKDTRNFYLGTGLEEIEMEGVSMYLDPTSIQFKDLSCLRTKAFEQQFLYEPLNREKIYEENLDEEVIVSFEGNEIIGTLISYNPLVVKTEGRTVMISADAVKSIEFVNLPDYITEPTIKWKVNSYCDGDNQIQATYLTRGISWNVDYILTTDANQDKASLESWVTIDNKAGDFEDSEFTLVAGSPNVLETIQYYARYDYAPMMAMEETETGAAKGYSYAEEAFFEYHTYKLDQTIDLYKDEIKQIEFISADGISLEKEYILEARSEDIKANINFDNSETNSLGNPLPAGKVRIYVLNESGEDVGVGFAGENYIEHIAENEEISLTVGKVFDIIAKRTETDYNRISDCRESYSYKVELTNEKDEAVTVKVYDRFYGDWRIIETNNNNYIKESADEIYWNVNIPANGETTLTYTTERQWC